MRDYRFGIIKSTVESSQYVGIQQRISIIYLTYHRGESENKWGGSWAPEWMAVLVCMTQRSRKVGRHGVQLSWWLYRGEVDSKVGTWESRVSS